VIELAVRVVFSLAVVLGLLWFIARTSSRRFGGSARSMVRVVARQSLARSASLAVVEVGDRVLVVGVSENGVSLLTEMDPSELPETTALGSAARDTTSTLDSSSQAQVFAAHRAQTNRLGVLSPQTWRQAWGAAAQRTGVNGD
jgi:flagellar protein FliO/FliZ